MNHTTGAQRANKRYDAIWAEAARLKALSCECGFTTAYRGAAIVHKVCCAAVAAGAEVIIEKRA